MIENEDVSFGTSREEASEIIAKFLEDEDRKVLAVKGKWGVGKTHLVQNVLRSQTSFYYSSVFGISSLEQLKAQILANNNLQSSQEKGTQSIAKALRSSVNRGVEWITRKSPHLSKLPKSEALFSMSGGMISLAGNLVLDFSIRSIKNAVICIDDLERKSSNLQLDELLGFINYLAQESQSKIILIYDEKRFSQDDNSSKHLEDYREKVIDTEILLEPTIEENMNLVFESDPDVEIIRTTLRKTDTKNIRILRKIQWIIKQVRPYMEGWSDSLRNQLIVNSIVLALAKFDSEFPTDLKVIFKSYMLSSSSGVQASKSLRDIAEFIKTNISLSKFGYKYLVVDNQIIKLIETSSLDIKEFINQGNLLNIQEEKAQLLEEFQKLWEPYYISFKRNEAEIAENIIEFLQAHSLDLPIQDFERVEDLAAAVDLDISPYKEALLEKLIMMTNVEDLSAIRSVRNRVSDFPELLLLLEEKINNFSAQLTIGLVLSRTCEKHRWSQEEVEFLNNQTIDSYYQWLQEENPDLPELAKWCSDMNIVGSQNLRAAIARLATERKPNAMRAKSPISLVLSRICEKRRWSQEEVEFLNSQTIDSYYQWLQEENPDLPELAKWCLDMNIVGSQNLRAAIARLATESKLNAMRAKFLYDTDVNESENPDNFT
jgi:hypothetical protein